MCTACSELIKAIDAYIAKADEKLSDALEKEGFAEPEDTVKHAEELEEQLAEVFTEQSADFTDLIDKAKENGIDVEEVLNDQLPDFKANDLTRDKLFKIFFEDFSDYIPELASIYISQLDSELVVEQISQKTTAWVESWSDELSELMELSSHKEIENLLTNALKNGKSVDELARNIQASGIRDEYYKARRAAITETLRAHSVAREESIQQCPAAEYKEWVHTGSYRNEPRENHVHMNGQTVLKDQPFTLIGKDGVKYYPLYPRDTGLPAGESVNCHCIHRGIASEKILGLSLEERKRLQQQAIEEMGDDWKKELDARNKAKAGINEDTIQCDWLWNKKTVEERKKYFHSNSRWALFESGVIQNDADLERLYKTVDTKYGPRKVFKSLTELKNDGIITVSNKTLEHSTVGTFANLKNPKKPPSDKNGGKMKGGGHSQANIDLLESKGYSYTITKTYDNGVRIGNVMLHKDNEKSENSGQSWFPENWNNDDVLKAGTYVVNNPSKIEELIDKFGTLSGYKLTAEYNDIEVIVIKNLDNVPGSIFPNKNQKE
ncbi:phage minor head protein [Porcipelethomonas sp.]|uniref:phage minor head protein n=1 Tax=Porcipelethomonas sp. TaxID=2981675 RepID=UPI003EF7705D